MVTMKSIIILILMLVPVTVQAEYFEDFSRQDLILQSVFTGLTVIDWAQTIEFTQNMDGFKESNVILGEHPSRERINTLIPIGIVAHWYITYFIPKKYRVYWQSASISIEYYSVASNHKKGIRISGYF